MANEARISAGREEQVILSGQKNIGDKLREMRLAIELEKKFTKERILEGYLNIVFFNRNAYGIEAAAQYYYSIPASKLNLPQAALLAGLVNSPSAYDPVTSPENAIQRRNQVLGAMLEQGKITQKEHDDAVVADVGLKIRPSNQGCAAAVMAPYFCGYVAQLILNNPAYGTDIEAREQKLRRGGLTITTTLDSRLQAAAQAQVNSTAGANPTKWGASLVTIQPGTGKILAMAQNTVFLPQKGKFDTQLNFNVDSKDANGNDLNGVGGFQPGSTMKPFTFAQWLHEGNKITQVVDASRREYPLGFPGGPPAGRSSAPTAAPSAGRDSKPLRICRTTRTSLPEHARRLWAVQLHQHRDLCRSCPAGLLRNPENGRCSGYPQRARRLPDQHAPAGQYPRRDGCGPATHGQCLRHLRR